MKMSFLCIYIYFKLWFVHVGIGVNDPFDTHTHRNSFRGHTHTQVLHTQKTASEGAGKNLALPLITKRPF